MVVPGQGAPRATKLFNELFTTYGLGHGRRAPGGHLTLGDGRSARRGTIHHACGIPVNRRGDGNDEHLQRQQDIAKRVVQWRWLSIDEISVVSIWPSCAEAEPVE